MVSLFERISSEPIIGTPKPTNYDKRPALELVRSGALTCIHDATIPVYDVAGCKFTGNERDSETALDYFGARQEPTEARRRFAIA